MLNSDNTLSNNFEVLSNDSASLVTNCALGSASKSRGGKRYPPGRFQIKSTLVVFGIIRGFISRRFTRAGWRGGGAGASSPSTKTGSRRGGGRGCRAHTFFHAPRPPSPQHQQHQPSHKPPDAAQTTIEQLPFRTSNHGNKNIPQNR